MTWIGSYFHYLTGCTYNELVTCSCTPAVVRKQKQKENVSCPIDSPQESMVPENEKQNRQHSQYKDMLAN